MSLTSQHLKQFCYQLDKAVEGENYVLLDLVNTMYSNSQIDQTEAVDAKTSFSVGVALTNAAARGQLVAALTASIGCMEAKHRNLRHIINLLQGFFNCCVPGTYPTVYTWKPIGSPIPSVTATQIWVNQTPPPTVINITNQSAPMDVVYQTTPIQVQFVGQKSASPPKHVNMFLRGLEGSFVTAALKQFQDTNDPPTLADVRKGLKYLISRANMDEDDPDSFTRMFLRLIDELPALQKEAFSQKSQAIYNFCCKNGYIKALKAMLHKRDSLQVFPQHDRDYRGFLSAVRNGRTEIVEMLLPLVDRKVYQRAFASALASGRSDIMELMYKDKTCQSSLVLEEELLPSFFNACEFGHVKAVNFILRLKPKETVAKFTRSYDFKALKLASVKVLAYLLDQEVDILEAKIDSDSVKQVLLEALHKVKKTVNRSRAGNPNAYAEVDAKLEHICKALDPQDKYLLM